MAFHKFFMRYRIIHGKKKFSTKKIGSYIHGSVVYMHCVLYTENDGKLQNASVSECDMKWANRMDEKKTHTVFSFWL